MKFRLGPLGVEAGRNVRDALHHWFSPRIVISYSTRRKGHRWSLLIFAAIPRTAECYETLRRLWSEKR